ncbi:MAG: hypothetical protein JNM50_09290 [Chromatiales bacterium]|nr:hypothetical protein [Chromatiales bacterium]
MNRIAAGIAAIGLGLASSAAIAADSYNAVAEVTFEWATNGQAKGWTSSAANTLASIANTTYFSADTSGANSTTYYNPDFAKAGDATGWCAAGQEAFQAQYACKVSTNTPIADFGPGAQATGTITVTDTTMTGTLVVIDTNDEGAGPQPGTTEATGYNIRSADGSPFKNVWYGISNQMTLTVNLTGTFTSTSWEITGGTVSFNDPAFQCAFADFGGVLCNTSTVGGGFQPDGSMLSWGIDQATGANTAVGQIPVFNAAGDTLLSTLSGVLASLSVDGSGNVTTNQAEFRNGTGSSGGGCPTSIRYSGTGIGCGTLQVASVSIAGIVQDTTPDAIAFTAVTGAALATLVESEDQTIQGVNPAAPISIAGGEYRINGGAWTSAAGSVINGDVVRVRVLSSALGLTEEAADLTVGTLTVPFSVTTQAADTSPDPINFAAQIDVPLSTLVTSNTVTITGIDAPTPISVTDGEYSINGGAFTSAAGNVVADDEVQVRQTSSATSETTTNTFLVVGDQNATFSVTTGDTTPGPFSFTDVTGAPLNTSTISNQITVFGISLPSPITITGGEYQIGAGVFTSAAGTVNSGDLVTVRQTSSPNFSTTTDTVLNIGGVSDTFSVTTLAADTTPDAFTFTDQVDVAFASQITSAPVTITGINTGAAISVTGGDYSIDGGAFTNAAGTVTNGQQVRVRVTSAATPTTATNATLTVGGVSDTFTVTTVATPPDVVPNAFFFDDVENADQGVVVESNVVTITGIDPGAPIRISGPAASSSQYRINGGAWTNAVGTINPGDTLQVRHTTASIAGRAVSSTVTIGNPSPAPATQRYQAEFTSVTTPAGGGSSSMDFLALGLLGGLAFLRRRRPTAG